MKHAEILIIENDLILDGEITKEQGWVLLHEIYRLRDELDMLYSTTGVEDKRVD